MVASSSGTKYNIAHRQLSKGVDYLVEAAAAEAEAISATLAAAKARQVNGEVESPDRDRGAEATPSGKQSSLIKPDSAATNSSVPPGVRLHHRAVSIRTSHRVNHVGVAKIYYLHYEYMCRWLWLQRLVVL